MRGRQQAEGCEGLSPTQPGAPTMGATGAERHSQCAHVWEGSAIIYRSCA